MVCMGEILCAPKTMFWLCSVQSDQACVLAVAGLAGPVCVQARTCTRPGWLSARLGQPHGWPCLGLGPALGHCRSGPARQKRGKDWVVNSSSEAAPDGGVDDTRQGIAWRRSWRRQRDGRRHGRSGAAGLNLSHRYLIYRVLLKVLILCHVISFDQGLFYRERPDQGLWVSQKYQVKTRVCE